MKNVLKRLVCFVCLFALVATMFPANVAEAATKKTIKKGQTVKVKVGWNGDTINVTLTGITNTAQCQGHPSWVSVKKNGYNTFTITIDRRKNVKDDHIVPFNSDTKERSGDIVFREGGKVYTLRVTQKAHPYNVMAYHLVLAGWKLYEINRKFLW